jgi:hypothetical protein
MSLSLADMLTRVKRYVPTTTMDTELQDSLLERMNYLVSLDVFPFQEKYEETTITGGSWNIATPDNFGSIKDLIIYTPGRERPLTRFDAVQFDRMFPMISNQSPDEPKYYCIKVANGEIWFDCPMDQDYILRIYFYAIPDDATDTTVSQLTELAKLVLIKWASADGFRMMEQHDRAMALEGEGEAFLKALKRRYAIAQEEGSRMISAKAEMLISGKPFRKGFWRSI